MLLHDHLAARSDEVMFRWKAIVRGTLAPDSMPATELLDHLPEFLQEVISALADDSDQTTTSDPNPITTGREHGGQRLRLGFSLDSVVREYGSLRDAIMAIAVEAGIQPTFREMQVIFDCVITGIANAVSQYAQERDAELVRHANEHFAFIAHEVRNPLSAAASAFELLRAKGQLPAAGRAVAALERGLKRTSELIEQTLKIARVSSGVELHRERTTLQALIDDVELGASSEAEEKQIALHVHGSDETALNVDIRLVRSALGNLVRNAVKYSRPGSTVEVRGSIANERAVIEIEDGCGGLAPGMVEKAFAPFVRFDNVESGFGLGLAIAKQAVDAHGGSIRVQNLPGKGCIFVLEFPVA